MMPDLSDGTVRFLYLIAILANPHRPALSAIDEPEAGLHPTMLRLVGDLTRDAATSSQVILATHSPELLEALGSDEPTPTTVVFERCEGASILKTLHPEDLAYWLKRYSLGEIFRTGELEAME
jgi:predicted ATPase